MQTAAVGSAAAQALAREAMDLEGPLGAATPAEAGEVAGSDAAALAATSKAARSSKTSTSKKAKAKSSGTTTKGGKETKAPASKTKVVASGKGAVAPADGGYAAETKGTATAKATASASRNMSLEDRLFEFMKDYAGKVEKQLNDLIEEANRQEEKKKSGGGFLGSIGSVFDVVKAAVPFVGQVEAVLGKATTEKLIGLVGGPLLGALASTIGGPVVGALVAKVAPDLIGAALDAKIGGGASSSSGGTSKASGGTSEQAKMLEIQRLANKLQEMFSTMANVLKSLHDSKMAAIGNIR